MGFWSWLCRTCSMSAPPPEPPHVPPASSSKPRARANTSFSQLPWRRNKPDANTSTSLASMPAAPVQTLPIDTLVQLLTPPAVPSIGHARALVTALPTQTPPPAPQTLTPIISGLCSGNSLPLFQAAGYDILAMYCATNGALTTSDRLVYLSTMPFTESWSQDVWEPRLKALNALISSVEDVIGAEETLLRILSSWVLDALEDYCLEEVTRQEKERAVVVLNDAYIGWYNKLDTTGRISESFVSSLYDLYTALIDKALCYPVDSGQHSSASTSIPSTPHRENSSASVNSPNRHRRHPSSTTNITSPLIIKTVSSRRHRRWRHQLPQ